MIASEFMTTLWIISDVVCCELCCEFDPQKNFCRSMSRCLSLAQRRSWVLSHFFSLLSCIIIVIKNMISWTLQDKFLFYQLTSLQVQKASDEHELGLQASEKIHQKQRKALNRNYPKACQLRHRNETSLLYAWQDTSRRLYRSWISRT